MLATAPGLLVAQSRPDPDPQGTKPAESAPGQPTRTTNLPAAISAEGKFTATDNGGLDERGKERNDFIVSLRPEIKFARQGAGFSVDLRAAANFIAYVNGTQPNGILPDLSGALRSSIVDDWLFFDAGVHVLNSEANPFGTRADELTSANRRTESGFSAAPYLERHFGPNLTVLAREELSSVVNAAGDGSRLTSNRLLLRIERKPVPFGFVGEVSQLDNRVGGSNAAGDSDYKLDTARLRGLWAPEEQLRLGAVVGSDRSDYLFSKHTDPLYGASIDWSPSARTHLKAGIEHRYFGYSSAISLEHRTPFMAAKLEFNRQPVDSSVTLGSLAQGSDVRTFLDAILTTRYPDPAARSGVVDGIVSSRGLNTQSTGTVDVVGDYPQLQTVGRATWMYLGAINTATISLFTQTSRQLTRSDDPLAGAVPAVADYQQRGASLQFNHKLTPLLTATGLASWSKIVGLGTQQGQLSDERNFRISMLRNLSPRTSASAGLQRTRFVTTAVGEHSYDATLGFVGLIHRF